MKKIVAVAAATMLAGSAFAADISFSYTGSNYFKSSGGNLDYDGDARTDCMSLTLSNDTAGVCLDFDTEAGELAEDQYYGWMNFGIPTGNLEVTAGVWTSRYVNRVKTDAGDLDSEDFELYKPGVVNGSVGKDSDNLTGNTISMVAAYTNSDSLPGTLLAKFGVVKSTYNPDADAATTATESGDVDDSDLVLSAGFVGELAYRQDGLVNINLAVKNLVKKNFALGLWISPLMVENLDLTVGGTVAFVDQWLTKYASGTALPTAQWASDSDVGNSGTEWGVDLRARYQLTEALSFTTMHNISSGYNTYDDNNTIQLWDMVNASFKYAENMTIGCTVNAVFDNLDSDHTFTGADVTTSPYLQIQATEKVAVTTALRFAVTGWLPDVDGHESLDVTIPVIFSFNY